MSGPREGKDKTFEYVFFLLSLATACDIVKLRRVPKVQITKQCVERQPVAELAALGMVKTSEMKCCGGGDDDRSFVRSCSSMANG